jgi:predicted dehydrogenase
VTVRFAVVGCGAAANRIHLPALRAASVDATVFASRSPASAAATRAAWGSGVAVDRWEDAVGRDDVDAVLVTTPNVCHRDVAVAAAKAGRHVLVDKPMACTAGDADEMIAAAAAAGIVLVPFQNLRFAAPFVAAHRVVAEGRLGDVSALRAAFGHGGPHTWAPEATWFYDGSQSGGGCLIDLGVHILDVVRYVTGDDIVEVAARLQRPNGGVEIDAHLTVGFRRGAIGSVHASWSSSSGLDQQLTIIGTSGTLHVDARTPLTLFDLDGEHARVPLPDGVGSPLAEFLAAVRGERAPSVTAADGRAAVAIVDAAYRAAATGRTETVT